MHNNIDESIETSENMLVFRMAISRKEAELIYIPTVTVPWSTIINAATHVLHMGKSEIDARPIAKSED